MLVGKSSENLPSSYLIGRQDEEQSKYVQQTPRPKKKAGFFGSIARVIRSCFPRQPVRRGDDWYQEDVKEIANHELDCEGISGLGTFGIVYKVCPIGITDEHFAVKRIELDDDYETREIEIHRLANHQNVVALRHYWSRVVFKEGSIKKTHFYMVMDYLPGSLEEQIHTSLQEYTTMSPFMIKVFSFQMFRALNYLHASRILHRDVKPSNLLVSMDTGILKICDFGCAKRIKRREGPNRTYICSRYYRAPELVLLNIHNNEAIDIWAAACVVAECFRGWPMFPGKNTKHQFGAIADVLGNPTSEDLYHLNPSLAKLKAKLRDASGTFEQHFPAGTPASAIELLTKIFVYRPVERLTALEACADPYFDQLRGNWDGMALPSGMPLPPLFNFSVFELSNNASNLIDRLFENTGIEINVPEPVSQLRSLDYDSVSADSDEQDSEDVFSELDSDDVAERELWDCRYVRIRNDEADWMDDMAMDENEPLINDKVIEIDDNLTSGTVSTPSS